MKVVIFDDLLCRRQADYRVAGLELAFYEDADNAADILSRERPDLVCMDFSMEGARDGAQVVRALRQDPHTAPLRIVAISSDNESNSRLLAAGADDAIPKTHLRAYLRRLADRQRLHYHIR